MKKTNHKNPETVGLESMGISIIIIVKNDTGIVATLECVANAIAASEEKVEVIVIDASSSEAMKKIANNYEGTIRWIKFNSRHSSGSKKTTIPEQRNLGISMTTGKIIVFIDANCTCKKDWLVNLTTPIINKEENICVGGVMASSEKDSNWDPYHPKRNDGSIKQYLSSAGTGNMAVSRQVFRTVGGFDENFLYGSDVEFTLRATDAGYRIRLVANAEIVHDWGDIRTQLKRASKYAEARVRIYRKHPKVFKRLIGDDFVVLAYPMFLLSLPLAYFSPHFCSCC